MFVLRLQKIIKDSERRELIPQKIVEMACKKTRGPCPVPEITYQNKDMGVEDIQNQIDKAFDLLFETAIKKLSTK